MRAAHLLGRRRGPTRLCERARRLEPLPKERDVRGAAAPNGFFRRDMSGCDAGERGKDKVRRYVRQRVLQYAMRDAVGQEGIELGPFVRLGLGFEHVRTSGETDLTGRCLRHIGPLVLKRQGRSVVDKIYIPVVRTNIWLVDGTVRIEHEL